MTFFNIFLILNNFGLKNEKFLQIACLKFSERYCDFHDEGNLVRVFV